MSGGKKAIDDEAYLMRDGCGKIASALADVGYSPR
jgi:hypothetical protein